jgi:hypothetical protein
VSVLNRPRTARPRQTPAYGPWRPFCWPQKHVWSDDNTIAVLDSQPGTAMQVHRIYYVCLACGKRHASSPQTARGDQVLW